MEEAWRTRKDMMMLIADVNIVLAVQVSERCLSNAARNLYGMDVWP